MPPFFALAHPRRLRSCIALVAVGALVIYLAMVLPGSTRSAKGDAPVLVITDPADPFGRFYTEILLAEGLNAFAVADVDALDTERLAGHAVVVLAETQLDTAQVGLLDTWVRDGGNLIAMRPGPELARLLGLGERNGSVADGYVTVDTAAPPGKGITADPMQFHGVADHWTHPHTDVVARLSDTASRAPRAPAVVLRDVGTSGGQAAAFLFDLARSVVYTRQGNPAWAGQERDFAGGTLRRSDDLFFGAKPGDVQPDWVNLDKVQIPQADEQQRLLANLITRMSADLLPLPRFWYLPRGGKAAVVLTGDDHASGGTVGQFDRLLAASPADCSLQDWECLRATSYLFVRTQLSPAQVSAYEDQGFELGLHVNTGCRDFTADTLRAAWTTQMQLAKLAWPTLVPPRTSRAHCIVWSDWATQAKVEATQGIRLDTNYYYWPASWVRDRPGMFTGSGFPMRFADRDGTPIDVYQAATQLTDESGLDIPAHIETLLANALGPKGYYGVFTANMHTDLPESPGADAIVAAAQAHGVPVISALQLLDWVDGRNDSTFDEVAFTDGELRFTLSPGKTARGLEALLPVDGPAGPLRALRRGENAVPLARVTIKGTAYARFPADAGEYSAAYETPAVRTAGT